MGVLGLWTLLDPVGKPVPVETLSHKVLAVDISIWLNQSVRGFRDAQGNGVANAHLLGLYHRICKLMFYKIKPVFVFDGAPPQLKKDTLARRRMKRSKETRAAKQTSEKILSNYIQRQAVAQKLNRQTHAVENALKKGTQGLHQLIRGKSGRDKDLFELPEMPANEGDDELVESEDESDSETEMILERVGLHNVNDVYQVDVDSKDFISLPKHLQYEVLNELKGKKKQNSWATMHSMPREAESFSGFQLERLKRRRQIEAKLDEVKEDLGKTQMEMLDSKLFVGDKAGMKKIKAETRRMASRPDSGIVFMSGLSQANLGSEDDDFSQGEPSKKVVKTTENEVRELYSDDEDVNAAIALSLSAEGPSQEDILSMIKKESRTDISIDADDDIVLIPTPQVFSSNRSGGTNVVVTIKDEPSCSYDVKEEIIEDESEEHVSDAVEIMSESSSDGDFEDVEEAEAKSSDDKEEDDLFADVFSNKDNVGKLDVIVKEVELFSSNEIGKRKTTSENTIGSEQPAANPEAEALLSRLTKLDKPSDIFADIASRAGKPLTNSVSDEPSIKSFNKEVSNNLKNGPGIMMKIASKWADQQASNIDEESDNSDIDNPGEEIDAPKDVFDSEQSNLLQEMERFEKENRLLKLTQGSTSDSVMTTTKVVEKPSISTITESDGLKSSTKGILCEPNNIDTNIGLDDDDKIYMAPAAGFVPGGRNLDKNKIVMQHDDGADVDVGNGVINSHDSQDDLIQDKELLELQERLAAEQSTLVAELGKHQRLSNSITDQMYADCQELLQLFGLPWIVAPGEAEAQCAYLDHQGLTQGTITDDSDIWLFGGSRVYKNFFDQEKYVEFFNGNELITHFGLTRDKLVCLALLTGSDYTEGVETVGPVTAMEILAEFPGQGLQPLLDFKQWSLKVGPNIDLPVGNKIREKLRKLKLSESFPSESVRAAYLNPSVDDSKEAFSWSIPNLVAVRDFALERFSWDRSKIDRLLKPVLRALDSKNQNRQSTLENYYASSRLKLPEKGLVSTSKRVEEAIRRVKGIPSPQKKPQNAASIKNTKKEGNKDAKRKVKKNQEKNLPGPSSMAAPTSSSSSSQSLSKSEPEVSLIAKSCGIVIAPSKDDIILQRLEREKKAKEAKEKAAEIFKKSQKAKQAKIQKRFKRPKRVELQGHGLSESDSDE